MSKTERKKVESKIIAEGEVTGHMHRATALDATVYEESEGARYLEAPQGTPVTHQEHHTLQIPPGNWNTRIVKELDPMEDTIRRVRD